MEIGQILAEIRRDDLIVFSSIKWIFKCLLQPPHAIA